MHVPAVSEELAGDELPAHLLVRITEGELKAHVATQLSGVLTLSVAGVSAWRSAMPVLRALEPSRVLLAFDRDAATNPHVARALEATAEALAAEGWQVEILNVMAGEGVAEVLCIELRHAAGAGDGADIDEEFDFVLGEDGEKLFEGAGGVSDGVEFARGRRHGEIKSLARGVPLDALRKRGG